MNIDQFQPTCTPSAVRRMRVSFTGTSAPVMPLDATGLSIGVGTDGQHLGSPPRRRRR